MYDYFQKFNELPPEVREAVSGKEALAIIDELEKKYGIDLAAVVMRVVVGEINLVDLPKFLTFEYNFDGTLAQRIAIEMSDRIFSRAAAFLGIAVDKAASVDQLEMAPVEPTFVKARGSSFFFSPEDEEEVRKLSNAAAGQEDKTEVEVEERVNMIVLKADISFSSELLADRFLNVLRTYLNNIRSRVEFKEALTRPAQAGGLGLDDKGAERVATVADEYKSADAAAIGKPPARIKVPEDALAKGAMPDRDIPYDLKRLDEIQRGAGPIGSVLRADRQSLSDGSLQAAIVLKPSVPAAQTRKSSAPVPAGKVRVEDVKFAPKLQGPIEELGGMDTASWRRLDRDPRAASEKIKEKLKYLEEEDYGKRLAGIRAWRQSPIFALYIDLGQESMATKQPVEALLKSRALKGEDYLTLEEYNVLTSLNRDLKY